MNRKLVMGGGLVAMCVVVCAAAAKRGGSIEQPNMWEKMRKHIEDMPEDFPPRIMFENVQAIRANTDEILTLMRDSDHQPAAHTVAAT